MARGEMFEPTTAREWQGEPFAWLARRSVARRLTRKEAECVNCYVRGRSLRQTGDLLGISNRSQVRLHLRRACQKLGALGRTHGTTRRWMAPHSVKTVLELMRTVDCNPRPLTYDALSRPVTLRARIITPDDFGQHVRDWMDDLDLSHDPELRNELEWEADDANGGEEGGVTAPGEADRTDGTGTGAALGHPPDAGRYAGRTGPKAGMDRRRTDGNHRQPGNQSAGV